jgi:hypothetical protein
MHETWRKSTQQTHADFQEVVIKAQETKLKTHSEYAEIDFGFKTGHIERLLAFQCLGDAQ